MTGNLVSDDQRHPVVFKTVVLIFGLVATSTATFVGSVRAWDPSSSWEGAVALVAVVVSLLLQAIPFVLYWRRIRTRAGIYARGIGMMLVLAYMYRHPVDTFVEPSSLLFMTYWFTAGLLFVVALVGVPPNEPQVIRHTSTVEDPPSD